METIMFLINYKKYKFIILMALLAIFYAIFFLQVESDFFKEVTGLFFIAILFMLYSKENHIVAEKYNKSVHYIGLFLIILAMSLELTALFFVNDFIAQTSEGFFRFIRHGLRTLPFLFAFGFILLIAGWPGIKFYKFELFIFSLLFLPSLLVFIDIDQFLNVMTSQFASFLLWYAGFNISADGATIITSNGPVQVLGLCNGQKIMYYLFGLSILGLFLFPIQGIIKFFLPFIAIFIGFIGNAIRIAVLVVLINNNQMDAFHTWHDGEVSKIFWIGQILIFILLYWFLLQRQNKTTTNPEHGNAL